MVDVVASIQNAIVIAGKLRALAKKIEDADFTMLLADLTGDLADAKLEVAHLKTQLAEALEEKRALENLLKQRASSKPVLFDGAYKFEEEDGLFCTACFDAQDKRIRVTPMSGPFRTFGKWKCPSCGAHFS